VLVTDQLGAVDLAGPDAYAADPGERDVGLHSILAVDGHARVYLDRARYRLLATRGLRHDVGAAWIDCSSSDRVEVELEVQRVVDTPGWLTTDLHVHSGRSADAYVPDRVRYRSAVVAGLDVIVMTDHNMVIDPAVPLDEISLEGGEGVPVVRGLPGVEARLGMSDPENEEDEDSYGHLNAFPLDPDQPLPETHNEQVSEHIVAFRERQRVAPFEGSEDGVVLQLNHPRGIQFAVDEEPRTKVHALFNQLGFDREEPVESDGNDWLVRTELPGNSILDLDAVEVLNRFSWPLYLEVRADWFALLNQGFSLTATGNSDSHAFEVEQLGLPMNLVACPASGSLDVACFVDAVQGGNLTVTSGPVVDLWVGHGQRGVGPGESLTAPGQVTVRARVRAAPWVPVSEVRLVRNGAVVDVQIVDGGRMEPGSTREMLDRELEWTLDLDRDSWLLVEAGWPLEAELPENPEDALGDYALLAPGYTPVGFTNPVRVDADGVMGWEAPGL
jgi:hypothetical protein